MPLVPSLGVPPGEIKHGWDQVKNFRENMISISSCRDHALHAPSYPSEITSHTRLEQLGGADTWCEVQVLVTEHKQRLTVCSALLVFRICSEIRRVIRVSISLSPLHPFPDTLYIHHSGSLRTRDKADISTFEGPFRTPDTKGTVSTLTRESQTLPPFLYAWHAVSAKRRLWVLTSEF